MESTFQPGDLVRRFASLYGWPVAERTILVEGETDQRYFALASRLYAEKSGLHLIGKRVSAFPTGVGEEGGAFGLQRHFHPLRAIMDRDLNSDGRKVFHAIALFDNDMPGKRGFNGLTGQHLSYRKWRDVFLLTRLLPRTTREPEQLAKLVEKENAAWQGIDCEIEDLISRDMITDFIKQNERAVHRQPQEQNDAVHCSFQPAGKAAFIRFVEANAILGDVESVVELLKSLRYHLGLTPDGDI